MTAPAFTGAFTMVDPVHVAEVGAAAAILFARICWRAERSGGSWYATRRTLALETGLTDGTLRGAVQALRDRDWITTERAAEDDATLVWTPVLAGHADIANPAGGGANLAGPPLQNPPSPPIRQVKDTPPSPSGGGLFDVPEPPPAAAKGPSEADLDAEFDRFWSLYPRRTGKKAARAAYGRARRTTDVRDIATGLRRQLPALQATEARFVPHPSTWLNQGRWEDEVQAQQEPPPGYIPPARTDPFAGIR